MINTALLIVLLAANPGPGYNKAEAAKIVSRETGINRLTDKYTPDIIKQYGPRVGIAYNALRERYVEFHWTF